ncbi:hypothetical protein ACFLVE_03820 [Chloroflexota bacterium]
MNKRRKEVPTTSAVVYSKVPNVSITLRTALYTRMYEIAEEHRDMAKSVAGTDRKAEIKESMIAILFAYTYLEAYINTIGNDRLSQDWSVKNKRMPLDKKWINVSTELAGHSIYESDKEPFKSFLELKTLREENLVHWKAQANEPVPTKYGLEDIMVAKFNFEKAKWACETVKQMVSKLSENMSDPQDAD